MEVVGSWCKCNSGGRNSTFSRSLWESESNRFMPFNSPVTRAKAPVWRLLWRKIKREKKKVFDYSSTVQFTYDPYTYSQNFDEGSMWAEDTDDRMTRSFSARFAVPSRVFDKNPVRLMD